MTGPICSIPSRHVVRVELFPLSVSPLLPHTTNPFAGEVWKISLGLHDVRELVRHDGRDGEALFFLIFVDEESQPEKDRAVLVIGRIFAIQLHFLEDLGKDRVDCKCVVPGFLL